VKYLTNTIKNKLKKGQAVVGSWLNLPSLETTEIMAHSGYEFLVIDAEHGTMGLETIQHMVMTLEGQGCLPLVRVERNDPCVIKRVLETGCYGVIVPMVNFKEDAKQAVKSIKYQPGGVRGTGLSRAQGYGLEFDQYLKWSQKNLSLIVQIEHIDAINNLEEILSVKGIDATMIGPYDLSASLGCPGDFDNEQVKKALTKYEEISRRCGVPFGYHIVHPDVKLMAKKMAKGYRLFVYGIDEIFLGQMARRDIDMIKGITKE